MLTSDLKGHRTLATVVFTDCVGFSARMSVDEEHTLILIRRDLARMKKLCEEFEGRVLKSTGDGLLMYFSSAVKAVECAVKIQREIAEAGTQMSPKDVLMHRIGIHLADMYITEADVMGNGVNIAARLQTEAEPGGICISQTVYDVAKLGFQVQTEYLGPRELKNIREVVPVYKIVLEPERHTDTLFGESVAILGSSRNLARIKKLLLYICKNRWQTDDTQLLSMHLKDIFEEFLEVISSFEQAKKFLETAVASLSKQTEYSLVANEVLIEVAKFYPVSQEVVTTGLKSIPEGGDYNQSFLVKDVSEPLGVLHTYEKVAQTLEFSSDPSRAKKLLYYVCRQQWISDPSGLSQVSWLTLVQELHDLAPNAGKLKTTIDKFVKTLNKSAEYTLVANTLLNSFAAFYAELQNLDGNVNPLKNLESGGDASLDMFSCSNLQNQNQVYSAIAQTLAKDSQVQRIKKLIIYVCRTQWLSDVSQLSMFSLEALVEELHILAPTDLQLQNILSGVVKTLSKPTEYSSIANKIVDYLAPLYTTSVGQPVAAGSPQSDLSGQQLVSEKPELTRKLNLFDVRLGILKYANPLRAKILVSSALYGDFLFREGDWLDLKHHELDDLLHQILKVCKTFTDLECLLYNTAKRLRTADEFVETASTVIKCLRTIYVHGHQLLVACAEEPSKISLNGFGEMPQELVDAGNEDEPTRQLSRPGLELGGLEKFSLHLDDSLTLATEPEV